LPSTERSSLKSKNKKTRIKKSLNMLLLIKIFKKKRIVSLKLTNMSMLTKRFKMKRKSKLKSQNTELFSCKFKNRSLKPRRNNWLKAIKVLSKKNVNKLKLRKHSNLPRKEVMSMRLPGSKLLVTKKHVKQLMLIKN